MLDPSILHHKKVARMIAKLEGASYIESGLVADMTRFGIQ